MTPRGQESAQLIYHVVLPRGKMLMQSFYMLLGDVDAVKYPEIVWQFFNT